MPPPSIPRYSNDSVLIMTSDFPIKMLTLLTLLIPVMSPLQSFSLDVHNVPHSEHASVISSLSQYRHAMAIAG